MSNNKIASFLNDSVVFHYMIYRNLTSLILMDI